VVPVAAVPVAETIVHAGDATVQSMVKSAGVKPTAVESTGVKPATMEPAAVKSTSVKSAAVESTAVEASTTVASTSAMRSVGEIWRAERSNAQHSGCGAP
jgi:hypothetical protein